VARSLFPDGDSPFRIGRSDRSPHTRKTTSEIKQRDYGRGQASDSHSSPCLLDTERDSQVLNTERTSLEKILARYTAKCYCPEEPCLFQVMVPRLPGSIWTYQSGQLPLKQVQAASRMYSALGKEQDKTTFIMQKLESFETMFDGILTQEYNHIYQANPSVRR
jgi:hypothetical protein